MFFPLTYVIYNVILVAFILFFFARQYCARVNRIGFEGRICLNTILGQIIAFAATQNCDFYDETSEIKLSRYCSGVL
jgi:hypothetical protein